MTTTTYTGQKKNESREALLELYRSLVGFSLPPRKQCWTLCNTQPKTGSEIAQYVDSGLITASQFHGIDSDSKLIEENKKWWPEAHFYCGDLFQCVLSADNFDPGLFFYDSTNTPVLDELYRNVSFIMSRCKVDTLVCVNVMLKDAYPPYTVHSRDLFPKRLAGYLMSDWDNWAEDFQFYEYKQEGIGATNMGMYAFVLRNK
jgi:hypothetical protein